MRSDFEINRAVEQYADMVRRICFCHLKNQADTEDVFQNVFLKYMLHDEPFESAGHEKAWFLRITINACKDYLKSFFRRNTVPEAVLALPAKYKDAIYLYYYEGYSAAEIGRILGKKENTVYSLLSRGRGMLRARLGGEEIVE